MRQQNSFALRIGLYDPQDGTRLSADAGDLSQFLLSRKDKTMLNSGAQLSPIR